MTPIESRRGNRVLAVGSALTAVLAVGLTACLSDDPASVRDPVAPDATQESTTPETAAPFRLPHFRPAAEGVVWLQTVPPGLRVDRALPGTQGGSPPAEGVADQGFCDAAAFPTAEAVDQRVAGASGPEYGELRDLRVFPDDATAHGFVAHAAEVVSACPRQEVGGTLWRLDLRASHVVGDESLTVVQTFEVDGAVTTGANWWEVVRVGNAVLVTATGGEWLPGRALDRAVREHARDVETIVAAMCAFAVAGCASPQEHDIPDGFPLAAGWPGDEDTEGRQYGLEGPDRQLPALGLQPCGNEMPENEHVDRLSARWTNVEDFRARQLTTFVDAGRAVTQVADLVGLYRGCPSEVTGTDGYTSIIEIHETDVGGESWAIVRRAERDGAAAVGLEVTLVIRLGRAVLVDTASNEGGAGQDPEADVRRQIRYQTDAAADVLAAMCAFTEAGCTGV